MSSDQAAAAVPTRTAVTAAGPNNTATTGTSQDGAAVHHRKHHHHHHKHHHHHHHHHNNNHHQNNIGSSMHSQVSVTSSVTARSAHRQKTLRRKTVRMLSSDVETKKEEARRAGHLAADRMWRVSLLLGHHHHGSSGRENNNNNTNNNNNMISGGEGTAAHHHNNNRMSAAAAAAAVAAAGVDDFYSVESSSVDLSATDDYSFPELKTVNSSERAIRRGRRRGSREANESDSSHGNKKGAATISPWKGRNKRSGGGQSSSYISPFDLTTIAEQQQANMTVATDGMLTTGSRHSSRASRSWFGGSTKTAKRGGKNNKSSLYKKRHKKKPLSAKQAAAMVAGWPGQHHLAKVLKVDQDPHERQDFYHGLGKHTHGIMVPFGLLGGKHHGNSSSSDDDDDEAPTATTAGGKDVGGGGGGGGDAWMCGVCGKAYCTLDAAEWHENLHIHRVVDRLAFCAAAAAPTTANSKNGPIGTTATESNSPGSAPQPPQGSPLTASNVAAAQSRVNAAAAVMAGGGSNEEEEKQPDAGDDESGKKRPSVDNNNNNNDPFRKTNIDNYNNHHHAIRESFGANHPQGTLVPRPRGASIGYGGSPAAPLSSSMRHQGQQQQQQGHRASEVRFEQAAASAPGMGDGGAPLPIIDTPSQSYANSNNNSNNESFRDDPQTEQQALLLSSTMLDYATLADEALVTVCEKARPLILTMREWQAELELAYLASDKLYYDEMARRAMSRISHPYSSRFRAEGEDIMAKVQNKFVDAYQLCKEGGDKQGFTDQYKKKQKDSTNVMPIAHTNKTLYLNVMVKNSIQVVRHELERLARERWERDEEIEKYSRFERFRVYAHVNIVRLAGIALASDFTPRRIAVQLSNDLYRLLTPRLKRRGVTISTEIEYRVGPYFVLAININTIRWQKLIRATYRDVTARKTKWLSEQQPLSKEEEEEEANKNRFVRTKEYFMQIFSLTQYDILAQFFAWFYQLHWIIYQPICVLWYYTFWGPTIRQFIISSVADEIFYYVEEKGMEMEIQVRHAATQAAFMLSALREIRADGQELKKKRQQSEMDERGTILGPLLGPAIKADKDPAVEPPGFELPDNLEFIGLELDLPVGFRRLRWAILSSASTFTTEALFRAEAKYDNITVEPWSKFNESIGETNLPDTVKEKDFIGAERVASYLMPKSAFVSANMCTETSYLIAYNDFCFCIKKKAVTPDVPYGSTFLAWTQILITNTGNDTCKLCCSVEPEFPNGPPMVSRQITSGMRAGVGEFFVKVGECITKYADEYP